MKKARGLRITALARKAFSPSAVTQARAAAKREAMPWKKSVLVLMWEARR